MPVDVVFLQGKEPLARQVAAVILDGRNARPIDLADTQVWVPTAGAGRRIREALATLAAEQGCGVLSPAFLQPMQALLPAAPLSPIATRPEREAAWLAVLRTAAPEEWAELLPDPAILQSVSGGLGVAGMFCDLCDLLAEGGLDPAHPSLPKICEEDAPRWQQLHRLYADYRQRLQANDLSDPNVLRLAASVRPAPAASLRHVVVACIPDLPEVTTVFLKELAKKRGLQVSLLIWKPADLPGGWDQWGRPNPAEWATAPIPLEAAQITVAREADDEAIQAVDFLARAEPAGDFALALADETLGPVLAAEIVQRRGIAFLPEGRPLAGEEAAKVALQWEKWRTAGDLRALRTLSQWPHFQRWLGGSAELSPTRLLAGCDYLIAEPLAETVVQAQAFMAELESPDADRTRQTDPAINGAQALLAALERVRETSFSEILQAAWQPPNDDATACRSVLEIWDSICRSPLFTRWPEGCLPSLARALRAEKIFTTAPEGAIELSGWLETPWIEAERLAICGCVEGRLPASVGEHPFLPDSKRAALGLQDNARRLARDACLLSCLLARHTPGNLRLSFSRFDAEGSPTLPSRLILRTAALPQRILQIFAPTASASNQPARRNGWRWQLPESLRRPRLEKISPTQCRDYLACPLRFYWKNVLRLDVYDPDPREMDPARFGILLHRAVEMFGRKAPHETKAASIEKLVLEEFAREARKMFGPSPTAAVRVQMEAAQVRLRAFARVQAAEFAAGWRIVEVERRFAADAPDALPIGPLKLSAQVDRIETHPEHGWRIMDYKTFSNADLPEKKHFGRAQPDHFLPQTQLAVDGKPRSWIDLQLPLYRFLAENSLGATPVQVSYFVLPSDPAETQILPLVLTGDTYQSALLCAEEIARRIARGNFWPPQAPPASWSDPFGGLFVNGAAEDCFAEETMTYLQGDR